MIENYKDKKLVEYLKDDQKVLVRFGHGLGDTILWYPCFEKLKQSYPKVHFDLYVESGQEEVFESIADKDAEGYDHVFHLDFPMSEGSELTKMAKCCKEEIGIEPPEQEIAKLPSCESPFVAVHFHGTALPGSVGCPEEIAKQIWQEVKILGKSLSKFILNIVGTIPSMLNMDLSMFLLEDIKLKFLILLDSSNIALHS